MQYYSYSFWFDHRDPASKRGVSFLIILFILVSRDVTITPSGAHDIQTPRVPHGSSFLAR